MWNSRAVCFYDLLRVRTIYSLGDASTDVIAKQLIRKISQKKKAARYSMKQRPEIDKTRYLDLAT